MDSLLKSATLILAAVQMVHGAEESIIRRAGHIYLIRIVSAKPGEWQPAPRRTRTRNVELRVRIEKALKGGGKPGELTIAVSQTEPSGPMDVAVPGVWSRQSIDASAEYVVFSDSASLAEKDTLGVRPAREAQADTDLALHSDALGWTLLQGLEHGAGQPLGPLFVQYASSRLPEILFDDYAQFAGLMTLLEKGAVSASFRLAILEEIFSRFLLTDPAPPRFVARLAAGSLRMIVGQDLVLRQRLIETLLPNLVGLEGGATPKAASDVLSDYRMDAERARSFLRAERGNSAARLLVWLH
jgi:hypothetical protein